MISAYSGHEDPFDVAKLCATQENLVMRGGNFSGAWTRCGFGILQEHPSAGWSEIEFIRVHPSDILLR